MTRNNFDSSGLTQGGSGLRKLASDIASYDCNSAKQACFFSANPPPYNFLANGVTKNYAPLTPINCPLTIAEWKFPGSKLTCCLGQGFSKPLQSPPNRGLSLLFDPAVDAFIAANAGLGTTTPKAAITGATVIVLSDFGAIYDKEVRLIGYSGNDWGEQEANDFLSGYPSGAKLLPNRKKMGTTFNNLFDCLCGARWDSPQTNLAGAIASKNVLVWNFMPFMRSGAQSSGSSGLPSRCSTWRSVCWQWLIAFLQDVGASKVILAVNKSAFFDVNRHGRTPTNPINAAELADLSQQVGVSALWPAPPTSKIPDFYQINHPGAWGGENKKGESLSHCNELKKILGLP